MYSFSVNQDKFFQQTKHIFPAEFIHHFEMIFDPSKESTGQQSFIFGKKLLEINQLTIYHMAQTITDLNQSDTKKSALSSFRQENIKIQSKDYQVLEEAVQKAQQQIRKHIGIQHQMKICLEELQDQLDVLTQENDDLKKENQFIKKQLSLTKKKEIEILKKFNQTESKISTLEQKYRMNKPSKNLTEPQTLIQHESSQSSLKKSFQNYREREKNSKKQLLSKNGGFSKLGSRKTSKAELLINEIDVNLHNFMTINTQIKKQPAAKTQGKEVFWNKRLKKREETIVQSDYSAIYQNGQNRSLNISPRQLRRQQKEKDLKEVYATNSRDLRRSCQPGINEGTATKKKERRDYSMGEGYQIKRTLIGRGIGFVDRSRSVAC